MYVKVGSVVEDDLKHNVQSECSFVFYMRRVYLKLSLPEASFLQCVMKPYVHYSYVLWGNSVSMHCGSRSHSSNQFVLSSRLTAREFSKAQRETGHTI